MRIGPYYFWLEIDKTEEALEAEEPSDYMYETTGNVFDSDENFRRSVAGRFKIYYVDFGAALNAEESIFDLFDAHSSTFDYFAAIFDPETLYFSAQLSQLFNIEDACGNVLIIDRLEILPKYRALNLGLIVMRRLIERFGAGAAVVAIKPFPLQCEDVDEGTDKWRDRLKLSELDQKSRSATAKLRRHYSQLGFKAMKGTPFMFRLTETPLPAPSDLVRKCEP